MLFGERGSNKKRISGASTSKNVSSCLSGSVTDKGYIPHLIGSHPGRGAAAIYLATFPSQVRRLRLKKQGHMLMTDRPSIWHHARHKVLCSVFIK